MIFRTAIFALAIICLPLSQAMCQQIPETEKAVKHSPSAAYQWLGIMLEAAARDVERIGAQPTILSRQMAIPVTAMFDAWAAYDGKAVGTMHGSSLRRPVEERTDANKEKAIAFAMYRTCLDQYPHFADYLTEEMKKMGYDPSDKTENLTTPQGIGNHVARILLEYRHRDGANQLGDEQGSNGQRTPTTRCIGPLIRPTKSTIPTAGS